MALLRAVDIAFPVIKNHLVHEYYLGKERIKLPNFLFIEYAHVQNTQRACNCTISGAA